MHALNSIFIIPSIGIHVGDVGKRHKTLCISMNSIYIFQDIDSP